MQTMNETEEVTPGIVYALAASPRFGRDARGACFAATSAGLLRVAPDASLADALASLRVQVSAHVPCAALSPHFEEDGHVYAGVSGGILRSTDAGRTWLSATFPPPAPLVTCLVISPAYVRDGTLFAGTLEDGVFISTDAGAHWSAWNFGLLDLNVLSLAISPDFERDECVYAGTESGLFRSTNGGRAWREVDLPGGYAPVTSLALIDAQTLLAGTEGAGLFTSADGGKSWQKSAPEFAFDSVLQLLLAPGTGEGPVALAVTDAGLLQLAGAAWSERPLAGLEPGVVQAVCAPWGLGAGQPLLVGLDGGQIICTL
jgi:photosystem II stability/assembly factor-like uncharacterized protein